MAVRSNNQPALDIVGTPKRLPKTFQPSVIRGRPYGLSDARTISVLVMLTWKTCSGILYSEREVLCR